MFGLNNSQRMDALYSRRTDHKVINSEAPKTMYLAIQFSKSDQTIKRESARIEPLISNRDCGRTDSSIRFDFSRQQFF